MYKMTLITWSPTFLGLVLLIVSQIDLMLFSRGVIDVRTLLSWEILIVLAGLISSVIVFVFSIIHIIKRRWGLAIQSAFNSVAFLVLFSIGGALGGAYLNVT